MLASVINEMSKLQKRGIWKKKNIEDKVRHKIFHIDIICLIYFMRIKSII